MQGTFFDGTCFIESLDSYSACKRKVCLSTDLRYGDNISGFAIHPEAFSRFLGATWIFVKGKL